MGTEVLVECEVSQGMFSDEAIVEVADQAYVVPMSEVRMTPGSKRGTVRAKLVKNTNGEWVVLPTNYSDSIARSLTKLVTE